MYKDTKRTTLNGVLMQNSSGAYVVRVDSEDYSLNEVLESYLNLDVKIGISYEEKYSE